MAGPTCTVCTHPKRAEIDKLLVQPKPRPSERAIAVKYGLVRSSVQRHKQVHLRRIVERAARAANIEETQIGASTLEHVMQLFRRALEHLEVSEVRGAEGKLTRATDVKAAMAALRTAAGFLGQRAELLGEVQRGNTTNILVDQRGKPREEWAQLCGVIFQALQPYPDAARAVEEAMAQAAGAPLLVEPLP